MTFNSKVMKHLKIVKSGVISLISFLSAALFPLFVIFAFQYTKIPRSLVIISCVFFILFIVENVFMYAFMDSDNFQVGCRAGLLGNIFAIGIVVAVICEHSLAIFGWYICVYSFFHYSEYLIIAICNPRSLSLRSFMLNHSLSYKLAALASWLEFFTELHFLPEMKTDKFTVISILGLCFCIFGEIVRKMAVITASTNFNHEVQTVKEDNHVLIKHGIYGLCRHPAYFGWFHWCIGTQLILVNPICTIGYALTSWVFFKTRLEYEEAALLDFFGDSYVHYKTNVWSGLPFIEGYKLQ